MIQIAIVALTLVVGAESLESKTAAWEQRSAEWKQSHPPVMTTYWDEGTRQYQRKMYRAHGLDQYMVMANPRWRYYTADQLKCFGVAPGELARLLANGLKGRIAPRTDGVVRYWGDDVMKVRRAVRW